MRQRITRQPERRKSVDHAPDMLERRHNKVDRRLTLPDLDDPRCYFGMHAGVYYSLWLAVLASVVYLAWMDF